MDFISISIAVVSLAVSVGTLWLTYLRRGRLAMTTPTMVFFGYDALPKITAKIFLRTLLFSTADRGQVVEGMFVKLRHAGSERIFGFWGYGETEKLSPGSGLYVSRSGLALNHHFVLSVHEDDFQFHEGQYSVEVYARLVGKRNPLKLGSVEITVSPELSAALGRREGILFERNLEGDYQGHARGRP